MFHFDNKLLAGDGDIKLSFIIKNKEGHYIKGKLFEENIWVSLIITDNQCGQKIFEEILDLATETWIKENKQDDYIKIPKALIRKLIASFKS